ncbi:MAG: MFS transporter [Micropruina sp.]|uniref:MFS transporter n=1 Tax=Micropruina sp. TaxID=2737536 RepID=UPI0039E353D2
MTDAPLRLSSIPGYSRYLTARVAAWIGNVMSVVALPVLIYQLTGSAALTGLLAAAGALPYLILGLPAGALADRWDARRTMAAWSTVAGVAMLSVSLAHGLGVLTAGHVIVTAFVVGVAFVFADAAGFGALPRLVGRDNVGRATASQSAVYTVISIAGPGVAGMLITLVGPAWVVGLDGVGYLVEAALIARLPLPRVRAEASGRPTLLADVMEGLRFVWEQHVIRVLTMVGLGLAVTGGGAVSALLVVVGVEAFGFTDDDSRLGVLYMAASVGSFLGSVLVTRLQRRLRVGTITLAGLAATVALVATLALTTDWIVGVGLIALLNATMIAVTLNAIVVRQTVTPIRLQSRVNTTARMISWGGSPIGATLGGLIAGAGGIRLALLLCAAGVLVSLAAGFAMGTRRIDRLDRLTPVED